MSDITSNLLDLIIESLTYTIHSCGIDEVGPDHDTGWRTLPSLLSASTSYAGTIMLSDNRILQYQSYEGICIPSGVFHRLFPSNGMKGISRWSHIQYQALGGLDIFSLFSPTYKLDRNTADCIGRINEQFVALHADNNISIYNRIKEASLALELLALIVNISRERSDFPDILSGVKRLYPALNFINSHFSECIDIKDLSSMCNLSRSRFDFLFTRIVGTAPGKYIQNLKLRKAQVLLATPDLAIYEVAKQSGFQDVFHFSRLFKSHTSMSPSMYRNRIKNKSM